MKYTTIYSTGGFSCTLKSSNSSNLSNAITPLERPGSGLKYFLQDRLGSVTAVLDASGTLLSEQRYLPFGLPRASTGPITQTDFGYSVAPRNEVERVLDNATWTAPG